jgi:hypothetical protein
LKKIDSFFNFGPNFDFRKFSLWLIIGGNSVLTKLVENFLREKFLLFLFFYFAFKVENRDFSRLSLKLFCLRGQSQDGDDFIAN